MLIKDLSGLAEGISSAGGALGQALAARQKNKELQSILNPQQGQMQPQQNLAEDEGFRQKFLDMVQGYENETGEMLKPEQLDMAWNASVKQAQEQAQPQGGPKQYNMQQLAAIAQRNPQMASMIQQNQLAQQSAMQKSQIARDVAEQKGALAKEKRAYEENKPYYTQIQKIKETLPDQKLASMRIADAMAQGDIRTLQNFLADKYDSEYLRTASLNELNSATKEFFMADVKQLPGGRLNQFLEKNLYAALQSGGKTAESNQKISEYQNFKIDLADKELEIFDRLRSQYERAGREPPANFKGEVDAQLKPYFQEKQKELSNIYNEINTGKLKSKNRSSVDSAKVRVKGIPPKKGFTWMLSPTGEPKQVLIKDIKRWEGAGGTLIR